MTRISMVGLGKLGACIAACFASRGFSVVGVDVVPRTIELINAGEAPVFEPGLSEMIRDSQGRLRATADFATAVNESDVTFILVPTPSEDHGGFSLKYVKQAARDVGRALAHKDGYHVVVITSTVLPGSTEYGILPIIEAESGKQCGRDFGLCYSPQFIALGSVIRDFLQPDFVLVGESDQRAGDELSRVFKDVCLNDPPIARMSFVNAELAKVAVNTYVTMKISYANMLAAICEQLPGGDVDAVTSALGLDRRIGSRYLKGALGYGGPCFPRDNLALAYLARQLGQPATLAEATDAYNRVVSERIVEKVASYLPELGSVAVLGLAYKPDTNVVEEAPGVKLADSLAASGRRVVVYDRVAMDTARTCLGDRVSYAPSLDAAVHGADVVLIASPDPEFRSLHFESGDGGGQPMVIDAWRLLRSRAEDEGRLNYLPLGVGPASEHLIGRMTDLWRD
jgi:UDPglucose 6-dehydrogenase